MCQYLRVALEDFPTWLVKRKTLHILISEKRGFVAIILTRASIVLRNRVTQKSFNRMASNAGPTRGEDGAALWSDFG